MTRGGFTDLAVAVAVGAGCVSGIVAQGDQEASTYMAPESLSTAQSSAMAAVAPGMRNVEPDVQLPRGRRMSSGPARAARTRAGPHPGPWRVRLM